MVKRLISAFLTHVQAERQLNQPQLWCLSQDVPQGNATHLDGVGIGLKSSVVTDSNGVDFDCSCCHSFHKTDVLQY